MSKHESPSRTAGRPAVRVEALMTPFVQCCHKEEPLTRAAQLMWDHDVGSVPVVDEEGKVIGMITDRDLCMAAYTRGQPLHELAVAAAMSADVVSCTTESPVGTALQLMQARQVRRLPVLDGEGRLAGVLSLADLACAAQPGPAEVGQALAWISRPRTEEPQLQAAGR